MLKITFDVSEINFNNLPSVDLKEKSKLPKDSGVYIVIDCTGKCLYIGRSTNILNRWSNHHRYAQFAEIPGVKITYLLVTEKTLLPEIEIALIEYFKPSLNGTLTNGTPDSKIRIKKYQQSKVELWCDALEINESRFVEDAITFYVRYLEGKHPVTLMIPVINRSFKVDEPIAPPTTTIPVIETDDPDEFDGGLDL